MKYHNINEGIFIERPNRFTAICEINGEKTTVHVKNTGRCRELLTPNAKVFLEKSNSPQRKTAYSLVAVMKNNRLINMDSQAPNKAVYEGIKSGKINLGLGKITFIKAETKYKNSRFDFYAETEKDKIFIEVKGVTLEKNNIALFPDAPTERGVKHINELVEAVSEGYKGVVIFVIQMNDIRFFTPNKETHPQFATALSESETKGVKILAYDCNIVKDGIDIANPTDVVL